VGCKDGNEDSGSLDHLRNYWVLTHGHYTMELFSYILGLGYEIIFPYTEYSPLYTGYVRGLLEKYPTVFFYANT